MPVHDCRYIYRPTHTHTHAHKNRHTQTHTYTHKHSNIHTYPNKQPKRSKTPFFWGGGGSNFQSELFIDPVRKCTTFSKCCALLSSLYEPLYMSCTLKNGISTLSLRDLTNVNIGNVESYLLILKCWHWFINSRECIINKLVGCRSRSKNS